MVGASGITGQCHLIELLPYLFHEIQQIRTASYQNDDVL